MEARGAAEAIDMPPRIFADGPGKTARVMIWRDGQPEQVEMRWGMEPPSGADRQITLLRSEGRAFHQRCLIIANDFYLRPGSAPNNKRRKVEMITSAPFSCFAGTWRSETATWPASFAGITVEAYPDIAPFQDRHMAVVREEDWIDWLSGARSDAAILRTFPVGCFSVSGPPMRAAGDLFAG
jgi:putative SOS response-associated peptidase YedK